LIVSKDFARAEREIQALLRSHPRNERVHAEHGVLAGARNQMGTAREAFERALEIDSGSIDALTGLIALDIRARDFASARKRIEDQVLVGTPRADQLLLAARSYGSMNDLDAAERMLRRTIEASPSLLPAYAMLGQLYLNQRKLDEARKEFDAMAERQSKPAGALTMSGVILQAQGNTELARQRFERAVAVDSQAAVAANNLAWIYAEEGKNLEQAVRLAVAASQALPEAPEVLDTLGWVYYKNNLPALAVPPLVRAVEKSPENPKYNYHLGLAYEKAGDVTRSRQLLTKALSLKADFSGADDAKRALARLDEGTGR
jgi:Tfp pilus assembly protein PilF